MAVSRSSSSIDALIGFCRRELAAVESYRRALSSLPLGAYGSALGICLRSHEQRAELLKSRIRFLHAEPPSSAGVLGAFARMLEGAAAAIGARMALAALEEEEELLARHYRAHLVDVDLESQQLIQEQVLPAQNESRRLLRDVAHGRHATSLEP